MEANFAAHILPTFTYEWEGGGGGPGVCNGLERHTDTPAIGR